MFYYYINMTDNNILILNIEKLFKNLKLFKKMYSNEYNNIYSIDLFDNNSLENFQLLIKIINNKLINKNKNIFNSSINSIKDNLNIIIIVIHANFLYLSNTDNNYLNYNDYVNLFNNINMNTILTQDNSLIQIKLSRIKILSNNYQIITKNIPYDSTITQDTLLSSVEIISNTINNNLKLLENIIYLIKNIDCNLSSSSSNFSHLLNKYNKKNNYNSNSDSNSNSNLMNFNIYKTNKINKKKINKINNFYKKNKKSNKKLNINKKKSILLKILVIIIFFILYKIFIYGKKINGYR